MEGIRRLLYLAGCILVCAPVAHAADADSRTYAVLSLIGDKISIVGHQLATGSHMDTNLKQAIPTNSDELDQAAVVAASSAIKRLDARATTVLLVISDPRLYEIQNGLFDQDDNAKAIRESVRAMVLNRKATHLILITKYRDDADLRFWHTKIGSGKIDGVGFYLDDQQVMKDAETRVRGKGFLAPFVYLKVALIDATTMTVLREQKAEESASIQSPPDSLKPWDALTAAQKSKMLQNLIRRAIGTAMPAVLAAQ